MSEQNVQVIVDGTLVEGLALDQVKQRVAQLFKTTVDKVEPMFNGKPFAVKKGLDLETARKYQAALKQAGLIAKLAAAQAAAAATQTTAAPATEKQGTAATLGNATIAATGSDIDTTPAPPPANIDTSALSMAAAGSTIMQHAPVAKPEIDTSRYRVEPVGQALDQTPPPAAPKIDISDLSMANAGEDVMDYLPIPEVELDTSALTMAEPGITIVEHKPVAAPQIDTSRIKLAGD